MRVGVLALQGGFAAHAAALAELGHEVIEVRSAAALSRAEGLVLPGGESGVQLRLIERHLLFAPLAAYLRSGKPILCTCAGLILAARSVSNPEQRSLGGLDVVVTRNGWGRQIDSFEAVADEGYPLVFIRAPRLTEIGANVQILAKLKGEPVLVRQGNIVGATFHPELTVDRTVHGMVFGRATN